jgi:hypothetical protein
MPPFFHPILSMTHCLEKNKFPASWNFLSSLSPSSYPILPTFSWDFGLTGPPNESKSLVSQTGIDQTPGPTSGRKWLDGAPISTEKAVSQVAVEKPAGKLLPEAGFSRPVGPIYFPVTPHFGPNGVKMVEHRPSSPPSTFECSGMLPDTTAHPASSMSSQAPKHFTILRKKKRWENITGLRHPPLLIGTLHCTLLRKPACNGPTPHSEGALWGVWVGIPGKRTSGIPSSGQLQHFSMVRPTSRRRLFCSMFFFCRPRVPYRLSGRQLVVLNTATRSNSNQRDKEQRTKFYHRRPVSASCAPEVIVWNESFRKS